MPAPHNAPAHVWRIRHSHDFALDAPRILAILNITSDSFANTPTQTNSLMDPSAARDAALRAIADGADALDLGAESTRPGAAPVSESEELRRVIPAIRAIRADPAAAHTPITIDTTKTPVARAALDAGADAINDISAGTHDPAMLPLAAQRACGIILMHRLTAPQHDLYSDAYSVAPITSDILATVRAFLASRAAAALAAGIAREAIVLDPGLGFGKTVEQNLALIRRTSDLASLGYPILSALSRKSFVGRAGLGRDSTPDERLPATLALSAAHYFSGARLFRVHDAAPHKQALSALHAAVMGSPPPPPNQSHGIQKPIARGGIT